MLRHPSMTTPRALTEDENAKRPEGYVGKRGVLDDEREKKHIFFHLSAFLATCSKTLIFFLHSFPSFI